MSENSKKQIRLSLQKIHNWPSTNPSSQITLNFSFYSKQSQHLITHKQIKSIAQDNKLQIGISLKICYPQQQSIVVIAIKQIANNNVDFGQVQIDLDELRIQKCKYLAFGNYEKILQVGIGEIAGEGVREVSLEQKRVKNKQFIEQRSKFLQQYKQKNQHLRQQFQQKISSILKSQKPRRAPYNPRPYQSFLSPEQKISYEQSQQNQVFRSEINKRQLQQLLITRSAYHEKKGSTIITHLDNGATNAVSSPRRHKLILGTLNIVEKDDHKEGRLA